MGVYAWYILDTWHIPAQSLVVICIFWLVYLWYMSYTTQTSVNVPSTKISHLHLEWAICGDVCQMYTRIWNFCRNLLIFVPRHTPHICQVFGSRYRQVKLEGPLHIPGIHQNVVGLGFAGIRPVDMVLIWHTTGIRCFHLCRN